MKKISQTKMAKKLKLSQAYLSQILTGAKPVSYPLAHKWSKDYGKDIDWWLDATPKLIRKQLNRHFEE